MRVVKEVFKAKDRRLLFCRLASRRFLGMWRNYNVPTQDYAKMMSVRPIIIMYYEIMYVLFFWLGKGAVER